MHETQKEGPCAGFSVGAHTIRDKRVLFLGEGGGVCCEGVRGDRRGVAAVAAARGAVGVPPHRERDERGVEW